jgi:hypothetical protein
VGSWDEREEDFEHKPVRQTAKGIVWVGVLTGVALTVFGVLGVLHWGFGVFTSDVKGRGDAEVIKNDARSRIRAQEGFEKLFADVRAADQQLNVTAEVLGTKPGGDVKLETELLGQKHYCLGLVSEYNAKARSFSQQDFKAADLPQDIDQAASDTDCKEN